MKKLIILTLLAVMMVGCAKQQDPLRYKGCVVIGKWDWFGGYLDIKLNPTLRDSLKRDYCTIETVKYDWDKYNVGDTIK